MMLGKNFFALDWQMCVSYASAEITEYAEGQRTAKNEACSIYVEVLEDRLKKGE